MIRNDLEIVERCLLLFSKPGRWTQRVNARDRDGRSVPVFSSEARSFSLEGAIRRAAGEEDREAYRRFVMRSAYIDEKWRQWPGPLLKHIEPFRNPFDWNDTKGRTQKDVVRLLEDMADDMRYGGGER